MSEKVDTLRWNPGWEELGAWIESLDMSGPTPGLFRVKREGERVSLHPLHIDDLTIGADRERLIDEARD